MNNAEYEQLITKAPLHPIERRQDKRDAVTDQWVTPIPIDMVPKLTAWEQVTLKVDAVLRTTKFIGAMTPYIINIVWSYLMSNQAKLVAAIVALIVAVAANFDFVIPEAFAQVINVAVTALVFWLIPAPKAKVTE